MNIPQEAIDAAAEGIQYIETAYASIYKSPDAFVVARAALEAAEPYIRAQVAKEIRLGINEYSGQLIEKAAQIAATYKVGK